MKNLINCPICDGNAVLSASKKNRSFRKENFELNELYYKCSDCKEEFTTTEIDEVNVSNVYNQYREKYKIPTPEQLTLLKEKYGLSSSLFSSILGFGVNQFSNYEKGELPNESNGNLLSLAVDPSEFLKLVERKKDILKPKQFSKIKKKLEELIEDDDDWVSLRKINFVEFEFPDRFNGFTTPSFAKFSNMVVFFINNAPFKTRLNKLLFYSDFTYFKYFGKSISGLKYAAIPNGPVPNDYEMKFGLLSQENILSTELTVINKEEVDKFVSQDEFNPAIFSETEIDVLLKVFNHFQYKKTQEIIDISHEEEGWKANIEKRNLISYLEYAPLLKAI